MSVKSTSVISNNTTSAKIANASFLAAQETKKRAEKARREFMLLHHLEKPRREIKKTATQGSKRRGKQPSKEKLNIGESVTVKLNKLEYQRKWQRTNRRKCQAYNAKYLGISLQELFSKKLMIDWWWTKNPFLPAEASLEEEESERGKPPRPIFLISPAIDTGKPGQEYPANPNGMCAFYDPQKQRCTIHAVKPFECRQYMHYDTERDVRLRQKEAALTWNNKKSQEQIKKLLGGKRDPRVSYPTIEEIINQK